MMPPEPVSAAYKGISGGLGLLRYRYFDAGS